MQPREHPCPCLWCGRQTWNVTGECDVCLGHPRFGEDYTERDHRADLHDLGFDAA